MDTEPPARPLPPGPATLPVPSIEGGGGTAAKPELPCMSPLPRPLRLPIPPTEGGGGTTPRPEPPARLPRPLSASLPAPSTDGGGGTAAKLERSEPLLSPPLRVPELCTDGGGGTTPAPIPPNPTRAVPADMPRSVANSGAGPTTTTCMRSPSPPFLILPREPPRSAGGGATTPALGPATPRLAETAPTSGAGATATRRKAPAPNEAPCPTPFSSAGAGATTTTRSPLDRRVAVCLTSGGGPMTESPPEGARRCSPGIAAKGMGGATGVESTAGGSRPGFVKAPMSGGAIRCSGRALASRATWMTVWGSNLCSFSKRALGGLLPTTGNVESGR